VLKAFHSRPNLCLSFRTPRQKIMAAFHGGDAVGAIVVDVGSATTKIGWAGDDYPKALFRSVSVTTRRIVLCRSPAGGCRVVVL
jgi:hypothetical protein